MSYADSILAYNVCHVLALVGQKQCMAGTH